MLEFSKSENWIVIKPNNIFRGIGVVAILMALGVIRLICGMLPFEEGHTGADIFGFAFLCLWVLLVFGMGIFALITNSVEISIGKEGVSCTAWFQKQFLNWEDVADWGLSYCGQTRGEGNTYYLYFSDHICPEKNAYKKKLRGRMIKTFVMGNDYIEAVSRVIPFCRENTDVEPFIGEDKFHLI